MRLFVMVFLFCAGAMCRADSTSPTLAQRGLVLPLYAADQAFDYGFALEEIAATGANSVSLAVVLLQENASSTEVYSRDGRTVTGEALRRTIRQARAVNLDVMLFPIVLLEYPREEDWRGNLAPDDARAWFASYRERLLGYARIAQEEQCAWFSVGSELSSLESRTEEWKALIKKVRGVFDGKIIYSCNWDHLDGPIGWWQQLDAVGLSSYYELTGDPNASQQELDAAWRRWRDHVLGWRTEHTPEMPIVFTEVGYPSMDGAAIYPWDYTRNSPPDPDEQRRCYRAFISAWHDEPAVGGVYFYKWLTFDADDSRSYTPRGKPAEVVMREWFRNISDSRGGAEDAERIDE